MKLAGIQIPPALADALRSCREHFIAAAVFSFFINLLYLAPPIYMLQVYDRVVTTGGKLTLLFVTIALAIALLTLSALDSVRMRLLVRASLRLDEIVAPIVLQRIVSKNSAEAVRAMRDFDAVRQVVGTPVLAALFDAPWAPLYILVAFMLHFWIGVLAVISGGILLALAWWNRRSTREASGAAAEAIAASNTAIQTLALHSGAIRALGMSGKIVNRQLLQRRFGLEKFADAQLTGSRLTAFSRFFRLFVQSLALGLGALLAIEGYISAGAIIAASILLGRALQPIEALISGWPSLNAGYEALGRLSDLLQHRDGDRIYTKLPTPEGKLAVENVAVRGPGNKAILQGVSFAIAPGEMLGIVGPSGSGKTTLAKVICGAMPAEIGTVRVDGAQLSDWDPDELGRHVGYLPQDPSLFEGTVKENIARFDPASEEVDAAAVAAAKSAGIHDLILSLPEGYDTRLGPLGKGLSAGQAQRVALARALYGNPAILILDEPNAFLDQAGEEALMSAVSSAMERGCAVMMIAHRRGVLDCASRLLVLDEGRPRMLGPPAEVSARLAAPPKGKTG
ncbi:type I secretion system permease/ATPase [Sphingomonas sp. SM33]|uniref:Type I secretion system permease/ATPase n=1 Tax=Sphingomonas telluris TaxID=2907998 RepID=A0ABS9VJJ8_9SPHN|nr:type I secretion system permease/ATPase [Sphingomonas telluris]MCH8614552.1 type I secretion system permease/ATPase [Sphingomonas telluris]